MFFQIQMIFIYVVGLLQGMAAVFVPAAGALLTNGQYHDLSPSEYGALFIPMVFGSIGAYIAANNMVIDKGLKPVFLLTLLVNAIALGLFASTHWVTYDHLLDYAMLLIALLILGMGFGASIMVMYAYVKTIFNQRSHVAITVLQGFMGVGAALAPLLFNSSVEMGVWWFAPGIVALLFVFMFVISAFFLDQKRVLETRYQRMSDLPPLSRNYVLIAGLYGFCETVFANWVMIYLFSIKHLSSFEASAALSLFWGCLMLGRLFVFLGSFYISPARIFVILPLLIAVAFLVIPEAATAWDNYWAYAFAGLSCSACLPLVFGFAQRRFKEASPAVVGRMTSAYMSGYAVAAYGVGVFHEWFSLSMNVIYILCAIPALIAWFLVLQLSHRRML